MALQLRVAAHGGQWRGVHGPTECPQEMAAPAARAHWLGGRGVLPRRWSLSMERLRGMAAPSGVSPPAGGTGGGGVQPVVAAYRAPTGDGSPQRRGPGGWGDGGSYTNVV